MVLSTMMAVWMSTISLLLVLNHFVGVDAQEGLCLCMVDPPPEHMIAQTRDHIGINCVVDGLHKWLLNKQRPQSLPEYQPILSDSDQNYTLSLFLPRNGEVVVKCVCTNGADLKKCSATTTITILDQLNPQTSDTTNSIIVSWNDPYHVDNTRANDDIWYTIRICKMLNHYPASLRCHNDNTTKITYTYRPDFPSPCDTYTFTVTPHHMRAGEGESSQTVTGAFDTGLEPCDPERPSWNTVRTSEHVCLVSACSLTMGVFTVVETTTHKWLHVLVSSDMTYPLAVGMDAASVVVYPANHTGFPINGSLPVANASFNQNGKSEVVEGDDFFSGYNLPNSTLKVDGVQGLVVCNTASSNVTDCAAVCIKNKDKRIYVFPCVNAEHTCYFDLIPGSYICGVVPYDPSGVLLESNGTLKEVEAKDKKGTEIQGTPVALATCIGVSVAVAVIVIVTACTFIVCCIKKQNQSKCKFNVLEAHARDSDHRPEEYRTERNRENQPLLAIDSSFTNTVPDPMTVSTHVPDPTTVSTPVPDPTTVSTPVSDPTTVSTPVPDPTTVSTPVSDPTTVSTPVPDPTTVSTTVSVPTTVSTPVPDPTTVFDSVSDTILEEEHPIFIQGLQEEGSDNVSNPGVPCEAEYTDKDKGLHVFTTDQAHINVLESHEGGSVILAKEVLSHDNESKESSVMIAGKTQMNRLPGASKSRIDNLPETDNPEPDLKVPSQPWVSQSPATTGDNDDGEGDHL